MLVGWPFTRMLHLYKWSLMVRRDCDYITRSLTSDGPASTAGRTHPIGLQTPTQCDVRLSMTISFVWWHWQNVGEQQVVARQQLVGISVHQDQQWCRVLAQPAQSAGAQGEGNRNFRSLERNLRSWGRKFYGTFVPGGESSIALLPRGAKVPFHRHRTNVLGFVSNCKL